MRYALNSTQDTRLSAHRNPTRCRRITPRASCGGFQLDAGEVIIREGEENERWLRAEVSWVSNLNGAPNFGIRLLVPYVSPGKAVFRERGNIRTAECLLLHNEDLASPTQIVMSPARLTKGTNMSVESNGGVYEIFLRKELGRTQGYAHYRVEMMADRPIPFVCSMKPMVSLFQFQPKKLSPSANFSDTPLNSRNSDPKWIRD